VVFDELMAIRVDVPVDGSARLWPSSRSSGFAGVAVPAPFLDRWIEDMWLEPQPWAMCDMEIPMLETATNGELADRVERFPPGKDVDALRPVLTI
jgi:hypothetical protein